MIPGNTPQEFFGAAAAAAAGGVTAGRSVRFNSADSAYLSRTPASAGNRTTWTWSGWVKRAKISYGAGYLFMALIDGSNYSEIFFDTNDTLGINNRVSNSNVTRRVTTQVFRDPSAWYHIVVSSNGATSLKLYVNGTEVTQFSTSIGPTSANWAFNSTSAHSMCALYDGSDTKFDGYLALVHFIDGQALTPSSFGETSATTGQWIAKTYSGTYGTNGFFLDFLDNSTAAALGYDAAGSNDWTVNNIQAAAITNTGYSVYFDGAGDRITASDSRLALGSGDWTVECYFKADVGYATQSSLVGFTGNNPLFEFDTNKIRWMTDITYGPSLTSGTWYHAAWTRSGSTGRIFLDGVLVGTVTNSTNYTNSALAIGSRQDATTEFKGWISNVRIVVGTALYTADFARPAIPLSAVSGTKLLTCQSSTIVDNSGNSISLTTVGNTAVSSSIPSSVTAAQVDSLRDHPVSAGTSTGLGGEVSGNYCTINPLGVSANTPTISDGNLQMTLGSLQASRLGTIGVTSGKWYWEIVYTAATAFDGMVGVARQAHNLSTYVGSNSDSWGYYYTGVKYNAAFPSSYGNSWTTGDVIGVALDMDNLALYFSKNGTWQNSGVPTSGASKTGAAYTNLSGEIFPALNAYGGTQVANFGQRAWAYTAPSGFSPLVDTLLPTPTIAKPNTVMDVLTWTGDGNSTRSLTGLGFNPDLVWLKSRSVSNDHNLFDSVRGVEKTLSSNLTAAEVNQPIHGYVTAFNSDGFSVAGGSLGDVNYASRTYVGWTWDAGSSNATNTSGTITSTVRANISAGFSVVTYTGTGSSATVGHGLGNAPNFYVIKRRDAASSSLGWIVFSYLNGALKYGRFDSTSAFASAGESAPTSSVFSILTNADINANGGTYVAYCWAPVAGYSAFGSYTGNGSSDGPFVYTGFRPRWVLIKMSSSTGSWYLIDTARLGYNPDNNPLYPNLSVDEQTDDIADILSNGFKIRNSFAGVNTSSGTYVWAAFAENPFAYARAR